MDIKTHIYEVFHSYHFKSECKIVTVEYNSENFGNFLLELFFEGSVFRIINDRGQLFIDKYNNGKDSWYNTDFLYSGVSLDNIKESLYLAFDYINYKS